MTRNEIKTLATSLTAIPADADTLPRFIDDIFNEVAFLANPPFLKAAIKSLTAGIATYSFETDMLRLIAAFYDDELLSEVTTEMLSAYSTTWAADSDTPTAIPADADTLPRFIDDIFNEVAFLANPPFLKAAIKSLTAGNATYSFETDMLRLIAAFYDDELLSEVSTEMLSAYSTTWAADSDTPTAITQDELTARDYTVYPNPSSTSDPSIPTHGEPFGEDFADNSLILIYAENRTSSILDIFALPFILEALAREFDYPSSHADPDYSAVCRSLSNLLGALTGVR